MLPTRYFVVTGAGISTVSCLNAFDAALLAAGIGNYNLVPVSSILPADAQEVTPPDLPPGSIVYVVLAREDCSSGEHAAAAIAWGFGSTPEGHRFGLVAESHGHCTLADIEQCALNRLREMARVRRLRLESEQVRSAHVAPPIDHFGCAIAALVLF